MQRIQLSEPRVNKFGESYFSEINHLAFEKLSSDAVFKSYYSDLLEKEEYLYVVIGTDSGLLYQYIKEQKKHKNLKFIFVDFKEVNEATGLLGNENAEIWDGDVRLVNDPFKFSRIGNAFNTYIVRRKITLIKSLAVMDAKPGTPYHDLWEQYEVIFNTFRRSEFNAQSTRVFEEERIFNAADNQVPVSVLGGSLNGKDVLVLGGGPTLDDSIDWIRENQSKLVIFAAARISKRLAKEGILPDFFITVDPFDWSFDNSKSVLAFARDSILVHSFHAQHKLVSQWNGLSAYAGHKYGFKQPDTKPNIETPGPTVTNAALHVAASLGAKRVFLSGVDFCFAKGLTHESGSDEAKMSDTFGHKGKAKVKDNAGNMTETGDDFYSAMHAMQAAIKMYLMARKNMEFYSLGLHSAYMENVTYVPCDSVVLNEVDKTDWSIEVREKLTLPMEVRRELAESSLDELSKQLKRFNKLQKLSAEGVEVTAKLYDPVTHAPKTKQMEKVKKLRKKVDALVGEDGDMIMNYQAAFFYDTFKPVENEQLMEREEIVQQLTAYFGGVERVSEHFIGALTKGIERAQLRVDELSGTVMPSQLKERWATWHEFGRAVQWSDWHSSVVLTDEERASLDASLEKFNIEYEKQDHNYLSRVKRRISDVSILLARANIAFNAKNAPELQGLIEHSEELDSKDDTQKQSFISLLKGMYAHVQDKNEEAIAFYAEVQMPVLRHLALKKSLDIFMTENRYEDSLKSLEKLCEFSLDYMVPYADLLGLLGQKEFSAQVMQMYLSTHPENFAVQNKFAQLLIDLGQHEQALQTVNYVLENEPENKTAQHLRGSLLAS